MAIPLVAFDGAAEEAPGPSPAVREIPNITVLIADDNATNRELFTAIMSGAGAEIVSAENGAEAVSAALSRPFDVIFMDVHMPIMDGMAATRELRSRGVRTPIIALTADVLPRNVQECQEAGMTGYLAKPYKPAELFRALDSALDG